MPQIVNPHINPPSTDNYALDLMPARSQRITKVSLMPGNGTGGIGGVTRQSTGEVFVPDQLTAKGRLVRYHEGLHAQFTSKRFEAADRLDQVLEDMRIHHWCGHAAKSPYQQARRDEIVLALCDLRMCDRTPLDQWNVSFSVGIVRAFAILSQPDMTLARQSLLKRVCDKLGKTAWVDIAHALNCLERATLTTDSDWRDARRYVEAYFTIDFQPPQPEPDKSEPDAPQQQSGERQQDRSDDSDDESTDDDSDSTSKSDKTKDSAETDNALKDNTGDTDTDSDSESDEESTKPAELETPREMEPATVQPKSKKKKPTLPDEYTADLAPAFDTPKYRQMADEYPLKLFIRRLDMGINRIKTLAGRRAPLPVHAGSRIRPGKLTSAVTTPGTRLFDRRADTGQGGTILIDASGSMRLPEKTLVDFCCTVPLATIGFYNAPDDCSKHGNIYIYAANGYRANGIGSVSLLPDFGSGNVIDYQALAWLLKQPAPRYFVSDWGFTGAWRYAALDLAVKCVRADLIYCCRTLADISAILSETAQHKHTSSLDCFKRFWDKYTYQTYFGGKP